MREVKFRAWYSGQMVEVGSLDFFTNGSIHVNDELVGCKLMQYTGLKDKNGKEIYEGDIVAIHGEGLRYGVEQIIWDQTRADYQLYDGEEGSPIFQIDAPS